MMNIFQSFLFILLVLSNSSLSLVVQDTDLDVPFEISGSTMGPIGYKVIIAQHPDTTTPTELQSKVQATLDRVNQLMSTYIPESDVSRFNQSKSTDFQDVDLETATVVQRALQISNQTNGAFDITVGPAVNLWNFGPNKTEFKVPTDEQIDSVRKLVGYEKLSVRMDPPAISKSQPELKIDLSAIAKGYAVDQVAKTLDEQGCLQFMVEVGGEVFTRGERFGGGPWRVRVERPAIKQQNLANIAGISDLAMATSGDYRNFVEHDGARLSHTIDPQTCRPVPHSLASACVIAEDCMTADALATAIMVLGREKGIKLCEELGIQYLIAERDSDFGDELTQQISKRFPLKDRFKAQAQSPKSILPVFLGAAVVFGLMILAMAVGSIFANKPVQGSCGGLASVTNEDGEESCGICSKPTSDCVERTVKS